MRKVTPRYVPKTNLPRTLADSTIADQFQGMEVEFDDKVNLFPVQVEDRRPRVRSNVRRLRS